MDEQKLAESRANMTPEEQQALDELLANMAKHNAEPKQTENVPWLAILGAALGAIPGIFAWFGIGMLGYTWSLVGAVIVMGVFFMYDKFGGEGDNQYGVIGCILICLIAVYLDVHLAWAGQFHKVLQEDGDITFAECVTRLYEFLDVLEIKGKFVFAVLKGYLFAGLGAFGIFSKIYGKS